MPTAYSCSSDAALLEETLEDTADTVTDVILSNKDLYLMKKDMIPSVLKLSLCQFDDLQ